VTATDRRHIVHLYDCNERTLIPRVARYLREALESGGQALAVVIPAHRSALVAELRREGVQVEVSRVNGSLEILDATWGLQSFLVNGYPDAQRFFANIGGPIRRLAARPGTLRVYGEMVGLLWSAGQYPAAVRLEQLWNRLLRSVDFELYCGYPIDVFDREFCSSIVGGLFDAHSHLVSDDETGALDAALDRAVTEISPAAHYPPLPSPEAKILWLRDYAPRDAEAVISRARWFYATAPRLKGRTTQISVP
jgi:MEDS: MEthanogen/methylotroph, DcmR Sensory domain